MNRAFKLVLVLLLIDAAPASLIAGAVRDQFGEPIAGATVIAGTERTTTGQDGTFALQSNALSVRIECTYCQAADVAVQADGTVAALIVRYSALRSRDPSPQDIAALPYAHVESDLSLRPYAVLFDSSGPLPGPQVSLYGSLLRTYGLLFDNGVPSYDSAAGNSPYRTIPGFDFSSINIRDVQDAPRYGDLAGNGTFSISSAGPSGALLYGGSQRAVRLSAQSASIFGSAASFSDDGETTSRVDAGWDKQYAQYGVSANVFSASDSTASGAASALNSFVSAAHATLRVDDPLHPYVNVTADRAGYTSAPDVQGAWSDLAITSGMRTGGAVSYFADAGGRFSSQLYMYGRYAGMRRYGSASEIHIDGGAEGSLQNLQWQAMVAGVGISDSVHADRAAAAQHNLALTPSFDLRYWLGSHWNVEATAVATVHEPDLERRTYDVDTGETTLPRETKERAAITYTDLRRVSFEVTVVRQFSASPASELTSAGASAAWQISPVLSLRAWTLRMNAPYETTPASAWLAYRAPFGVTADVIWRRDLLDLRSNAHVDASLGFPIARGLQLFAGSEQRAGERYTSIGVRAFTP